MFKGSLEDIKQVWVVNGEVAVYTGSFSRTHVFRTEDNRLIQYPFEESEGYKVEPYAAPKSAKATSSEV